MRQYLKLLIQRQKKRTRIGEAKANPDIALLGIFLIPLVVNPYALIPYEIPKISWLMIWIVVGVATISYQTITKGISLQYNRQVLIVLALWFTSLAVSTIFSVAPLESFWGSYERLEGFVTWCFYGLHFLICYKIFQNARLVDTFFSLTFWIGIILSIYAILQYFRMDPFPLGDITLFNGRTYTTIGQPTMFGQWLIFPIFIAGKKVFQYIGNKKKLVIYLLLFTVITAGLYTTLNRATFLAIGVTIIIGLFLYFRREIPKWFKWTAIFFALLLIFSIFFMGTLRSLNTRMILWTESIPLIENRLVFGSGLETYYQTYQLVSTKEVYETEQFFSIPDRVHNVSLQILLDQGVFGFIIYLIPILFLAWLLIKKHRDELIFFVSLCILASYLSVQWSFFFSAQMVFFLAMWGILLSRVLKNEKYKIQITNFFAKVAVITLSGVFAIWTISLCYGLNLSNYYLDKANNLYFSNIERAFDYYDKACTLSQNYTFPCKLTVELYSNKDLLDHHPEFTESLESFSEKVGNVSNYGFQYYILSALLKTAEEKYEAADKDFRTAAILAQNYPYLWYNWGITLANQKRYEEAIPVLENMFALAPSYLTDSTDERTRIFRKTTPTFLFAINVLGEAYTKTGHMEKAIELNRYLD